MSKSRIVGMTVLIVFAIGIVLVGNAVAGEKFKWRVVWYTVKFDSVNVPSEEGRVLLITEDKGILTVLQGSKVVNGMVGLVVRTADVNIKTGTGSGHGEILFTDRDGDKMYWSWEGAGKEGPWSGPANIVKGTGKFQGLKGKATWYGADVAPNQFYVDWEGEMDLPR